MVRQNDTVYIRGRTVNQQKFWFTCHKAGKYAGKKKEDFKTGKCGCPCLVVIVRQNNGDFQVTKFVPNHNHSIVAGTAKLAPMAHKLTPTAKANVMEMLQTGMDLDVIIAKLEEQYSKYVQRQDLYNLKVSCKRNEIDDKVPKQIL